MKKIITIIVLLGLLTLLLGCSKTEQPVQQPIQQPVAPVEPVAKPATQITIKQDLGPKQEEIVIGNDGNQYNGNSDVLMGGDIATFIIPNIDSMQDNKFYFQNLWSVHKDFSESSGNTGSLWIKTTAKKISLDAGVDGPTDLRMYKGNSVMPQSDYGQDVTLMVDSLPGMKIQTRGTYNLVHRLDSTSQAYRILFQRPGLKAYKLILEY